MRIWPINARMPRWGICEVREMTDKECERMNRRGINWAPISMGFVNLFKDDVFMGWCGVAFAKRRLVGGLKRQKLPKHIRDIPI